MSLLCLALLGACAPASEQQAPGEGSGAGEIIEGAEAIATEGIESREADEVLTARQAFSVAEREAASWAPDAVLLEMKTFRESETCDGRAGRWVISFESSAAQQRLEVHVMRGEEVLQTMEEDYEQGEAMSGDWTDRPAAIGVADQHMEDRLVKGCWMSAMAHRAGGSSTATTRPRDVRGDQRGHKGVHQHLAAGGGPRRSPVTTVGRSPAWGLFESYGDQRW